MHFVWKIINFDTRSLFYIGDGSYKEEFLIGTLFKGVYESKIVWAKVTDIDWVPKSMIIDSTNFITAKAKINFIIKTNLSNYNLKFDLGDTVIL